jgi:MORN repeat
MDGRCYSGSWADGKLNGWGRADLQPPGLSGGHTTVGATVGEGFYRLSHYCGAFEKGVRQGFGVCCYSGGSAADKFAAMFERGQPWGESCYYLCCFLYFVRCMVLSVAVVLCIAEAVYTVAEQSFVLVHIDY